MKIKYKLIDGEPMCGFADCPYAANAHYEQHNAIKCQVTGTTTTYDYDPIPCIPGLREQREELRIALQDLINAD